MSLHRFLRSFFFMVMGIASCHTSGIEVANLDKAQVPVASRAKKNVQPALVSCIKEVILKNSGTQEALSHQNIIPYIKKPRKLLVQYGYIERFDKLYLDCRFDLVRLHQILKEENLPFWDASRPLTTLWIATKIGVKEKILSDMEKSNVRFWIQEHSRSRGLPLIVPVMDFEDMQAINLADIKQDFSQSIAKASQRYRSDFFAVIYIEKRSKKWQYHLSLYSRNSLKSGLNQPIFKKSAAASSQENSLLRVMEIINAYYVDRYASFEEQEQTMMLVQFNQVNNIKKFLEIEDYLESLSLVKNVQIVQLKSTRVLFELALQGSIRDLKKLLRMEPRVRAVKGTVVFDRQRDDNFVQDNIPIYRWVN